MRMRAVALVSVGLAASITGGCGGATDTGLFGGGMGDGDAAQEGGQSEAGQSDAGRRDAGQRDAGGSDSSRRTADPGIFCGTNGGRDVNCEVGVASCCATLGPTSTSYECLPRGSPCAGLDLGCNDTADCGGDICCARFDSTLGYTSVTCQTSCNSTTRAEMLRFCDPTAATDECAASGRVCTGTSLSLPGYFFCR